MESFVFRSDLLTVHEPSRTRDEDEDEDEKRGQLPQVPHPASRTPHSEGSWEELDSNPFELGALGGVFDEPSFAFELIP
jgi:hypothetical protein